jgi:hypothetical protein
MQHSVFRLTCGASMNKLIPLAYVFFACIFFLGYSLIRPNPSPFEIVVFIIIVAMIVSGFSLLARNIIQIKDNKIALASGPIAALIGSLIVLIPFASSVLSSVRKSDGTCDIVGTWNCVNCKYNDSAEIYEVSQGGDVRTMEMRQAGRKWPGHFLFDRNLVFIPNLQFENQSVVGVVSRDCKRIDWNYLWVWQRKL